MSFFMGTVTLRKYKLQYGDINQNLMRFQMIYPFPWKKTWRTSAVIIWGINLLS
jgi:hypothetical protein